LEREAWLARERVRTSSPGVQVRNGSARKWVVTRSLRVGDAIAPSQRRSVAMILRLSNDELELMRTALRNEHARVLQEFAHLHCAGYSPAGIKLCQQRSRIEALLHNLDYRPAELSTVEAGPGAGEVVPIRRSFPWQDEKAA
jgi:hypothetical protein